MLNELHIENIAVIEKCDISFAGGLNVLTGETGAGKSIIIDALNAVLGGRTSRDLVRSGADSARVTAVFNTSVCDSWLEKNEIEPEEELILQRRITPEGKSSCRVNGVPVTAAQMRELSSFLVDIHGQNDGLRLLDERLHLSFLDKFSGDDELLNAYKAEYAKYSEIQRSIKALSMDEEEKSRLGDTLRYRIDELEKAELKTGEFDALRARRELLRNSEKLREALDAALAALNDGDENALSMADNALYYAQRAARFAPELEKAAQTLDGAAFALKDAAETLSDFRDSLDFSPEEYDRIEARLSQLERLSRKYNMDEEYLINYLNSCREKLAEIEYSDDALAKLSRDLAQQGAVCRKAAVGLSAVRKSAGELLQKRITSELKELNMPSVRFLVDIKTADSFGPAGADEVFFLMSANAGETPGKISAIASGGELSRIMLALKNVFAEHDVVETMIFDEIDTGVSGVSAQRVAEKLYSVSDSRQVMCVSHLPQIAAMADAQYLVHKSESGGRTFTDVTALDMDGRKKEIARLYGGDNITATTLAAAEEQIKSAVGFKNRTAACRQQ